MSRRENMYEIGLLRQDESGTTRYTLTCDKDETIYASARRQGFRLPASCLNGVCHVCRANVHSGTVLSGISKVPVSNKNEHNASNEIMLCQAWPSGQSDIEVKHLLGPGELPVKHVKCQVLAVKCLKGHVYQVDFQLPAGKQPEFFPGQYLALQLPDKEDRYFSIACRPGLRELTLHIQADPHLPSAVEVIAYLESCVEQRLSAPLTLPFGDACLTSIPDQALILIAAGTGFAQMKSMIEHLFEHNFQQPIALYWGVRKEEDMYLLSLAKEWALKYEGFSFFPVFSDIENIQANDHHNQLSDAVLAGEHDLSQAKVFVSGSPKLVFSAMDALMEAGLPESQFLSDVLAYATRES